MFFSRRKTIIWKEQVEGVNVSLSTIATALYEFRKGKLRFLDRVINRTIQVYMVQKFCFFRFKAIWPDFNSLSNWIVQTAIAQMLNILQYQWCL